MKPKLHLDHLLHGGDYNPDQWLDQSEIITKDFALFKEAKINTYTLCVFAWDKLEPEEGKFTFDWLDKIFDKIEANNGQVILATPSGARPRWMAEKYSEILRVNADGQRIHFGERHNHCYTSPVYRQKTYLMNQKLAEHFGKRKSLILWHISNEFSGRCYCPLCQTEFRQWLQKKYKTLDNINHAYWSKFWSHEITSWEQIEAPSDLTDQTVLGLKEDWMRFGTERTISFFENEIAPIREITPNIPVTTNFMGGNPSKSLVFDDLDYFEFAKHVDVVSWDSYPNWANDYESTAELGMKTALMNDMMRSLKHDNYLIMENTPSKVNWHPVNRAKRPGMHEMASLQEIAHGANSVMYFQLHASRGASEMFHGAVIDQNLSNQTRTFQDVKTVGEDLTKLKPIINTKHQSAQVAIVFDYDNLWALQNVWSYSKDSLQYWQTIQKHYQYFWEHDIPVEFISVNDDLTPFKLVLDPMHFMMDEQYAEKLANYVKNGGHLIGTYITGMVNKDYLAHLHGWPKALKDVYGIEFNETDTLYPKQTNHLKTKSGEYTIQDYCDLITPTTAKTLGTYMDDFYQGQAAITQNNFYKGTAIYLACRTDNKFLHHLYDNLATHLQLKLNLPIRKLNKQVSIQIRQNKNDIYYFVINFSHLEHQIQITEHLDNVLSHKSANKEITLPAYGVVVLHKTIKE